MAGKSPFLDHVDDPLLIALYNDGLSAKMIAEKWEVPERTMNWRLHRLGVTFRKFGGGAKGHKKKKDESSY